MSMSHQRKQTVRLGSPDDPVVIAHRGFSDETPENSMAAFRRALRAGVDMIELDVRLSADNQFVVMHDRRVDRTTDGHGHVADFAADELCALDNGSWYSRRFARQRVPLLRDVLPMTAGGTGLNIEIKPDVRSTNGVPAVELVLELARSTRALHRIVFSSFNHRMMRDLKRIDAGAVTGVLFNPIKNFRRSPAQLAAHAEADIFICSKYQLTGEVVNDAHRDGVRVYVYGVHTERDVRRALHLGVDGLIANNPRLVKESLAFTEQDRHGA